MANQSLFSTRSKKIISMGVLVEVQEANLSVCSPVSVAKNASGKILKFKYVTFSSKATGFLSSIIQAVIIIEISPDHTKCLWCA
jgi:hypothetical protein